MQQEEAQKVTPHQLREIAVRAFVDPRTVSRVLKGDRVKVGAAQRVTRVLNEMGLASLLLNRGSKNGLPKADEP